LILSTGLDAPPHGRWVSAQPQSSRPASPCYRAEGHAAAWCRGELPDL